MTIRSRGVEKNLHTTRTSKMPRQFSWSSCGYPVPLGASLAPIEGDVAKQSKVESGDASRTRRRHIMSMPSCEPAQIDVHTLQSVHHRPPEV
jgi:hypothetical protein